MAIIRRVTTTEVTPELIDEIRRLVAAAFGRDFSDEDWAHTLGGRHVVIIEGTVVAHAAVVPCYLHAAGRRWRTGYLEGVATEPERQGGGLGSIAIAEATELGPATTGENDLLEIGRCKVLFFGSFPLWTRHPSPTRVRWSQTRSMVAMPW